MTIRITSFSMRAGISKLDLDIHLKTPLLTALFNRRIDLLEKDIDMRLMP
jgi:hypothetical protein